MFWCSLAVLDLTVLLSLDDQKRKSMSSYALNPIFLKLAKQFYSTIFWKDFIWKHKLLVLGLGIFDKTIANWTLLFGQDVIALDNNSYNNSIPLCWSQVTKAADIWLLTFYVLLVYIAMVIIATGEHHLSVLALLQCKNLALQILLKLWITIMRKSFEWGPIITPERSTSKDSWLSKHPPL